MGIVCLKRFSYDYPYHSIIVFEVSDIFVDNFEAAAVVDRFPDAAAVDSFPDTVDSFDTTAVESY